MYIIGAYSYDGLSLTLSLLNNVVESWEHLVIKVLLIQKLCFNLSIYTKLVWFVLPEGVGCGKFDIIFITILHETTF